MPNTRLYDRAGRSVLSADQGTTQVAVTSGVANHSFLTQGAGGSDDLSSILGQFKEVFELGRVGLGTIISADASVAASLTVPTGKYWRLIGAFLNYTASADAATRTPVITTEQSDGTDYTSESMTTKTANQVENDHILFGSNGNVTGVEAVAAAGTLTVAVNPTANDTMTIDGVVYTFVAADDGSVTNAIVIGANAAATQANIEAVLVDGTHPTVNAGAFDTNVMPLTARTPGVAGDSIATTETFTSGSNVFDATTLGAAAAGVDAADDILAIDYPTAGVLLTPGEKVTVTVTNGHANDAYEFALFYLEFDHDPTA